MNHRPRSLYALIGALCLAASLLVLGANAFWDYYVAQKRISATLLQEAEVSLTTLQRHIAPLMESMAVNEYEKLVFNEIELRNLHAVVVEDGYMGRIFGSNAHVSGQVRTPDGMLARYDALDPQHALWLARSALQLSTEVYDSHGESIGKVSVYMRDQHLRDAQQQVLAQSLRHAVVAALMMALVLVLALRRWVIRPIVGLAQTLKDADEDGVPRQPVTPLSFREIAGLTGSLQHMIAVIRQSRAELQSEHDRLENVISGAHIGTWEWDMTTGTFVVNDRWANMLGHTTAELQPLPLTAWQRLIHPADRERCERSIQQHLDGQSSFSECEIRMRHHDGHWVWVLKRGCVVARSNQDKPRRMAGTQLDISERKRAEMALRDNTRLLDLLLSMSSSFINIPLEDSDKAIQKALASLGDFTRSDRVYVFDYDFVAGTCTNTMEWCAVGIEPQIEVLQDVPLTGLDEWVYAHQSGREMIVESVPDLPEGGLREVLMPQGIQSVISLPLMRGDECIGFVGFDAVRNRRRYDKNVRRLLGMFAQILVNIGERRRMDQQLVEQEAHFRSIFQRTNAGMAFADADGYLQEVNQSFASLLDHAPEELLGLPMRRFTHADDHEREHALVARIAHGDIDEYRLEKRFVRRTGETFWADTAVTVLRDANRRVRHYVALVVDIDERKRAEAAMQRAQQQAEAANLAKSRFLATMSHEIRTPMNAILGNAQLMLMERSDAEQQREYARTILTTGTTLMALLNDILDLSKIEADQLSIEAMDCDVPALLREVGALFEQGARNKHLDYAVHWHGNGRCYRTDPTRLRQILSNLIANAVKFTERGSIRIEGRQHHAPTEAVDTAQTDADCMLEFFITDTGIGIAEADQQRLFQPFTQVDASTTRKYGGTGLGLSIVQRLVRRLGGDIRLESEPGTGTRIHVTVRAAPLATCQACGKGLTPEHGLAAPAAPEDSNALTAARPPRVLIVEDISSNAKVVSKLLSLSGCESECVDNGRKALERLDELPGFDLVLMDCHMPVMDGYEATRELRSREAREGLPHLPVVALTASALEENRQRCLAAGMDDFLTKPVDFPVLHTMLKRLLPERIGTSAIDGPGNGAASDAAPKKEGGDCDEAAVRELIDELKAAIELRAFTAGRVSQRLCEALRGCPGAEMATLINGLLRRFDYRGAQELLETLSQQLGQEANTA